MAVVSSFCPSCQRTVYLGSEDTLSCPVCASPLVAAAPDSTERLERIANNESLFREVNERIQVTADSARFPDEVTGFVCECGRKACTETITLDPGAYETLRADPSHFAVLPGHVAEEAERVVEDMGAYLVVEKIGEGRVIAEERDPRS
ncbi:MAG: hypothetical protein QOK47_1704 [Actinomycetota bacterium]|nr:hypothetical protein [Actinomycetota bacterium]